MQSFAQEEKKVILLHLYNIVPNILSDPHVVVAYVPKFGGSEVYVICFTMSEDMQGQMFRGNVSSEFVVVVLSCRNYLPCYGFCFVFFFYCSHITVVISDCHQNKSCRC